MLTVHHLDQSRSQRILWMLEELGIPYKIELHKRDATTNLAPASLKRVHPLGKAPTIEDNGQVIAESGAIIDYLAREYASPDWRPKEPAQFNQYQYWMHYSEGTLMPLLVMRLVFSRIQEQAKPFFVRIIVNKIVEKVNANYMGPGIDNNLGFIEAHLEGQPFFLGEHLTAVDIMMSFPLEAVAATQPSTRQKYPNIYRYVSAIQQRDAYRAALDKGGDYDFLLR